MVLLYGLDVERFQAARLSVVAANDGNGSAGVVFALDPPDRGSIGAAVIVLVCVQVS